MTPYERFAPRSVPHLILLLSAVLMAGAASADSVPALINFQGRLADTGHAPIDDTLPFEFRIYGSAAGNDLLWSESWAGIGVTDGVFSVLLGSNGTPLPPTVFATGSDRWLELVVDGEVMSPRQRLGSVGYAYQAERVGGLGVAEIQQLITPPGTIKFFDTPDCPAGWTEYATGHGRAVVALPLGGAPGATVGIPLADVEDRSHGHSVDLPPVNLTSAVGHSHELDPPNVVSTTVGPHAHVFDPPATTSSTAGGHLHALDFPAAITTAEGDHTHVSDASSGSHGFNEHNHQWTGYTSDHRWTTFTSTGAELELVDWSNGMDTAGSGHYPISTSGSSTISYHTKLEGHAHNLDVDSLTSSSAGAHDHDLDLGAFDSAAFPDHTHSLDLPATATTSEAAHTHDVDIGAFFTSGDGAHTHDVDVTVFASDPARTGDVIPYIQLRICRKE